MDFLIKSLKLLSYSSVLLIHNISSKHDREPRDREIFRNTSHSYSPFLNN